MANDYNILADYIVSRYIERIAGDDIEETFVDESPADRVMVGMLAENRMEEKFDGGYIENNSTRFESVPSISISFIVKKNSSGVIRVIPKGLLFYTVEPDYDKTIDYLLQKYSEKDNVQYTEMQQLCECYPDLRFSLPLTYKKVRVEDEMGDGISIRLDSISDKKFHLEQKINERLRALSDRIISEIKVIKSDRVTFFDLVDKERFYLVTGGSEERVNPRWDISVKKWFAQYVHSDVISMFGEIDDSEKITKNVFALLHSMSHAFMNSAGELSGLSGNSLTEIILVETASIFIYAQTSQGIPLGALSGMAESNYAYFLKKAFDEAKNCVFDPICTERDDTACSACLIIPEISCNHFNAELGRKYLYSIDGVDNPTVGFWEM